MMPDTEISKYMNAVMTKKEFIKLLVRELRNNNPYFGEWEFMDESIGYIRACDDLEKLGGYTDGKGI